MMASEQCLPRQVHIVAHTHWDREWHEPFVSFRRKLVRVVDQLLDVLEHDPDFTHFLLDGQMAVVDDVLEIRPEHRPRIAALVAAGRLSVGPWYTLPDEFLVSGETLVRNLQLGLERAEAFGGAMEIGYLPDMFGHIAQMPQILRQLGFEHTVVWRGVPLAVDRTAFCWEALDGSVVRTEYLPQGYGNGAELPEEPDALLGRLADVEQEQFALLGDGALLWMNGSDHRAVQPALPRVVAAANRLTDRYALTIGSLAAHLATAPTEWLPVWKGELRSGARANLLMGVASNRLDVRQAVARAERELERLAEPLSALFVPAERWPTVWLEQAWLDVIRNAAHDSVCACSVDDVADAVLARYADASGVARDITTDALRFVGAQQSVTGPVVVNPSARDRSGLVELQVAGGEAPLGTQLLEVRPGRRLLLEAEATSAVATLVEMVSWMSHLRTASYASAADGAVELVLRVDDSGEEPATRASVRAALLARVDDRPNTPVRAWVEEAPSVSVLAFAPHVPGFGWRAWAPGVVGVDPVTVIGHSVGNGLVTGALDAATGTFSIDGRPGFGRLVDGGDAGDTYNWCPPRRDAVVDRAVDAKVEVLEAGPLRARLRLVATYQWPARLDPDGSRRAGLVDVEVATTVELRAGERAVRVAVELDNRAEDHRLRAHFALPEPAICSRAECAFGVVERGLVAEGGPTEMGLPTFPARRFVQAGGLTVVHAGTPEYELVDLRNGRAHELALTLLRATGYLSRAPMATRPLPAGPVIPVAGAQVPGRHSVQYAVAVGPVDPYALADEILVPLQLSQGAGLGTAPAVHQALAVEGAEVSSLRRTPSGELELRVFNPRPVPAGVQVAGRRGRLVDLRGRDVGAFDESFELRAGGIATLVV